MLKLMRLMMSHEISVDKPLMQTFERIKGCSQPLTVAFALTKDRIRDIERELKLVAV
jgi:hypothetical protein